MTHISENATPLVIQRISLYDVDNLANLSSEFGHVYFLRLPYGRTDQDGAHSEIVFQKISAFCARLDPQAVICILTTPPDAARLHAYLESTLNFRLWIAVKTANPISVDQVNTLPQRHLALLVYTRYSTAFVHTKTRISYTYCPACGKTTKDYGGKKHLYHKDGTLISDVWRDIVIDQNDDFEPIIERLRDLFGLSPYTNLTVLDFIQCPDLAHKTYQREVSSTDRQESHTPRLRSRLIRDDCLNALRRIASNSIDFCFADLPYNLDKDYSGYDDTLELQEYFAWCDRWLSQLARVLKPGRTCAVLNIPLWAIRHFQHLATILDFQMWIAWEALAFPVRQIMPAHYAILCFSKGPARPLPGLHQLLQVGQENRDLMPLAESFCVRPKCVRGRSGLGIIDRGPLFDLWYDIHRLKHNSKRVDHPCQLPPALMRRLFTIFTEAGDIVLDCFNGAGTSTLVAAQMGRRYIGIEISKKYHRIALKRHDDLKRGLDPFRTRTRGLNSPNLMRTSQVSRGEFFARDKLIHDLLEFVELPPKIGISRSGFRHHDGQAGA